MKLENASIAFIAGLIQTSAEVFDREDAKKAIDVLTEIGATPENFHYLGELMGMLNFNATDPLNNN